MFGTANFLLSQAGGDSIFIIPGFLKVTGMIASFPMIALISKKLYISAVDTKALQEFDDRMEKMQEEIGEIFTFRRLTPKEKKRKLI